MSGTETPEIGLERWNGESRSFERISSRDLFGRSMVLLAGSEGQAWCEAARALGVGSKLDIHRIGSRELRDPEARFNVEFGVTSKGAVLVGPDRGVVWRAQAIPSDPEAELRGALGLDAGARPGIKAVATEIPAPQPAAPAVSAKAPDPAVRSSPVVDLFRGEGFVNPFARPAGSTAGMKLYMHPVSMTSRPIRLFIAESGLKIEEEIVDILSGQHLQPDFAAKNPTQMVPMLEDGDFRLTESSAILKYLADKTGALAYPTNIKRRAKIDEMMDWLNTQFFRDWAYNLCYPQLLPHHRRRSDEAHAGAIEWGRQNSQKWLQILNDHWIGERRYLCGDRITIADYFGSGLVTLGEAIHTDFSKYPNVERWLRNMKSLRSWDRVNEQFREYVGSTRDKPFETA